MDPNTSKRLDPEAWLRVLGMVNDALLDHAAHVRGDWTDPEPALSITPALNGCTVLALRIASRGIEVRVILKPNARLYVNATGAAREYAEISPERVERIEVRRIEKGDA